MEDGFFVRSEKTSEQWVIRFRDLGSWVGPTELGLFSIFSFFGKYIGSGIIQSAASGIKKIECFERALCIF